LKDAKLGTQALGLSFQPVSAQTPAELDRAIADAAKGGANALFILTDVFFTSEIPRIAQAAIKNRFPAVYDRTEFVEAGGLISYGVNLAALTKRAAEYVDQILKGAKPGDLTLVQPTKFDLSVNLKTANQIGVTIPSKVVDRAAKVIK
jgi:putative ABC transport system substrate-binding protein